MPKLRNESSKNFTILNNYILQSCFVSLKAIGLYAKLVSLPDDWSFSEAGLVAICKESRNTVRSALEELENLGLLFRYQIRDENGKMGEMVYYIASVPMSEETKKEILLREETVVMLGKSQSEPLFKKPTSVYPTSENYTQLNTKELNTKKSNNDIICETKKFKKPTLEEVKAYCIERNNNVDAENFVNFYESKGWKVGKSPMKDWKACVRTWEKNSKPKQQQAQTDSWADFIKNNKE